MSDTLTLVIAILSLLSAAAINTAVFIWRLIAVRDAIVNQMILMKTAIDMEIDMIRKEMTEHKVKIAEEYLRMDNFHFSMEKLEAGMLASLAKVEMAVTRLDDKINGVKPV